MTTSFYGIATPMQAWNCDHAPGNAFNIQKCGALIPSIGVVGVGSDTSGLIVFQGFPYLVNQPVSALICGIDCGDFTVDIYGQVTVPIGPSTVTISQLLNANNPGSYGNAEALIWLTVSGTVNQIRVPVVIGSSYTSQGQMLRAVAVPGLSNEGPALGLTRRSHMYAMHLVNVSQMSVGTNFNNLMPVPLQSSDGVAISPGTSYTGVVQNTLEDDNSFDGMFCWQINRPYSAMVASVNVFTEAQER